MIVDLERVTDGSERFVGDEVVRFHDVTDTNRRITCHVEAIVRRVGDTFYIDATVDGAFSTACHNCLEPARVRLSPSFSLVVRRAGAAGTAATADDDDYVEWPRGDREFDLAPYIHENVVLSVPMQIYCREDCKGLCATCGKNLNVETCTCTAQADPRWDALRRLRG